MSQICTQAYSGRRGEDAYGNRFLLNPSPADFAGYFRNFHGAAFIRMGNDISFGAGSTGSIDHCTIADSFSLTGEEAFRGYMRIDGTAQVEVWIGAETESDITDGEQARIDACVAAALKDSCLSRIKGSRELIVFSVEHGKPVLERDLTPVT